MAAKQRATGATLVAGIHKEAGTGPNATRQAATSPRGPSALVAGLGELVPAPGPSPRPCLGAREQPRAPTRTTRGRTAHTRGASPTTIPLIKSLLGEEGGDVVAGPAEAVGCGGKPSARRRTPSRWVKMSAVSTTSPSIRPGTATISRTRRTPSCSRAACTTRSMDPATVGTKNRLPTWSHPKADVPMGKGMTTSIVGSSRPGVHRPGRSRGVAVVGGQHAQGKVAGRIAYVRVSTARDEMVAPEIQIDAMRAWAAQNHVPILDVVQDLDQSGRGFAKRSVNSIIERIRRGEASGALVYNFSRFGRNATLALAHIAELEMAGGSILSARSRWTPRRLSDGSPDDRAGRCRTSVGPDLRWVEGRDRSKGQARPPRRRPAAVRLSVPPHDECDAFVSSGLRTRNVRDWIRLGQRGR